MIRKALEDANKKEKDVRAQIVNHFSLKKREKALYETIANLVK